MATFVLSFRGPEGRNATAEEEAEWGAWFGELGGSVTSGERVGRVQALGDGGDGVTLTGYAVVTAANFDAAVDLAKGCPGLRHGGGVEVGETVDMG